MPTKHKMLNSSVLREQDSQDTLKFAIADNLWNVYRDSSYIYTETYMTVSVYFCGSGKEVLKATLFRKGRNLVPEVSNK